MGRRMARKDRAPTPPKRPQAPQRRVTPTSPEDAAKRRRLIMILGASALVALAVVLGVVFLAGGDDGDDVAATMEAAGCEFQAVPAQPGDHTAEQDAKDDPKWNTDPPTSGPHYPVTAVYGEYDTPLQIAQVVHNLEHGGVFILYGDDVPEATISQLSALYNDDPRGMLLAPYPKLADKIALGAWTVPDDFEDGDTTGTAYLATCPRYDEDAFRTFRDDLRFRGPERFDPDDLQPGHT
jgi:hypothetical protein